MLKNDPWSHPSGGACNDFCHSDFNKQAISTVETEKEPNDLSFIGWPDIVTLEDADSMLRSFNSTFGSEEFGNEDDFSWPLSQCIDNGDTTFSSSQMEEFSNVCYGVAPIDSSVDMPFEAPLVSIEDRSKNLQYLSNPNCEAKGAGKGTPENFDSLVVVETSCLSTQLEETTLEASRLNQLQQVMDQLDMGTKLCLRDGLYRLARSAEQRHSSASANGPTEENNELMDIETETNPIDRSIAHLLFHRSLDPSANSACDGLSLESHAMDDRFLDREETSIT